MTPTPVPPAPACVPRRPARLHALASAARLAAAAAGLGALLAPPAWAFNIELDNPDIKLRWDTSVGYSLGIRTTKPSPTLTQGAGTLNFNDGDLNFAKRKRPIANRLDLFTEADVTYQGFGARVSAAAYYDAAYNSSTSNTAALAAFPPPAPFNQANTLNGGSTGQFTQGTKDLQGQKAEVLDAFVFGKFNLGSVPLNLRLGQHALLWGESLFFGFNGIAAGMAPIDVVKAQSAPNATVKEIIRPVGQLSGQMQLTPDVSVGAYVQYEWEKSRLPSSGSYYSVNDTLDAGGQRLYIPQVVTTPGGPLVLYLPAGRGTDQKAPDSGQFGLQTHFRPTAISALSDIDFGLYAIQYHSKLPIAYLTVVNPPGVLPNYRLVYAEKIRAYGASFNTTLGVVNLGGEASVRTNVPLTRGLVATTGGPGPFNASTNPAYPVGHTAHINLSTITAVPSYFLARESTLAAEFAWNRVLSCDLNCVNTPSYAPRDGNADRDAYGFRLVYTPVYRQAFTGIDVSVPLGLSYSPEGKSGALGPVFVHKGGDMSIGLVANVRETFTLAMNYTHYYGPTKVANDGSGFFNFGQALHDRDNVTFSARMSF